MNELIRKAIKDAGLKQWQIADRCGISEATLIRWLRHKLTDEQKKLISESIEKGAD